MGAIADRVVQKAIEEWIYFGRSTRNVGDEWEIGGDESDEPYRSHISRYWAVVGEPDWDGATPEPWSGAFICWCFDAAGAWQSFKRSRNHSRYIDHIRRREVESPQIRLRPPSRALSVSDLIWNARGPHAPDSYETAVSRLRDSDYFNSHVDVVVKIENGTCESIGGNVHYASPGGSVVRSTWRLGADGAIADERKTWLGVIKNAL